MSNSKLEQEDHLRAVPLAKDSVGSKDFMISSEVGRELKEAILSEMSLKSSKNFSLVELVEEEAAGLKLNNKLRERILL